MKIHYYFVLLLCFFNLFVAGQNSFQRVDTIPLVENNQLLQNAWAGGINFPNVNSIDLNGDGRKDLMLFDRQNNRITCYVNNGNTNLNRAWDYAPVYNAQFPPINSWILMYDYNCDGKEDLFTLSASQQNGIQAFRNDAAGGVLQWTEVSSKLMEDYFGFSVNVYATGVSLPAFQDLDNDGDMDILGYNTVPDGRIAYHKNLSMESYGICDSLVFSYGTGCWGDFTLLIGGANSVGCFNCPCRSSFSPSQFDEPSGDQSQAAKRDDTISGIFPIDIDGDSDYELLVGDIASLNSLLIVNSGTPSTALMSSQDVLFPSYDTPAIFNGFHNHAYIDVDNDGIKDLLVFPNEFENANGMWVYKNIGTTASPLFHFETKNFLQNSMMDVGESSTPALVDYDGDGLLDLVVGSSLYIDSTGNYRTSLYLYKNTGTSSAPAFQFITDDFASISQFNFAFVAPTFGDLDGDGDQDMLVGNSVGNLAYFVNSAGAGNVMNLSLANPQFSGIDVGNFAAPQIFDLDKDGKKDLLIGEKSGFINYFRNTGTVNAPVFSVVPDNDTLGCIVKQPPLLIDGYTIPFAFDSLGKTRLLVGSMDGTIDQYIDISGNLNGCFTDAGPIFPSESHRFKFDVAVAGGDLNNDGLMDLVVGISTGGVQFYYQRNPTASIASATIVNPSMVVYPNPVRTQLSIQFYNLKQSGNVLRIFNAIGKVVFEKEISENELSVNTEAWAEGNYLMELISEGKRTVSKFTVIN